MKQDENKCNEVTYPVDAFFLKYLSLLTILSTIVVDGLSAQKLIKFFRLWLDNGTKHCYRQLKLSFKPYLKCKHSQASSETQLRKHRKNIFRNASKMVLRLMLQWFVKMAEFIEFNKKALFYWKKIPLHQTTVRGMIHEKNILA